MGKRSSFERRERDYYPTPKEAVDRLNNIFPLNCSFVEPCAGDGRLIEHLEALGNYCVGAYDIEPLNDRVMKRDALGLSYDDVKHADYIITNPPWSRDILHNLIDRLSSLKPTWLLFDADWMHTKQASPWLLRCKSIVSVGRLKWIEGSTSVGKDNCAWYLFDKYNYQPQFYGRAA